MNKVKKSIYDVLRGGFLVDDSSLKNWRIILFSVSLLLIMIYSSHSADEKVVLIGELNKQKRALRASYIDTSTSLMQKKMESNVQQRARDIGLLASKTPPIKIKVTHKK